MRFRTSGRNWEGRQWQLADCLNTLGLQISQLHPKGHPADGTVASQGHDKQNPSSDHRPRPTSGPGMVRALDAGENVEDDAFWIAEAIRLSKDKRVKYVLHEKRIFSSYGSQPFAWRSFDGAPHLTHFHISTLPEYDNDTSPWVITTGGAGVPDMANWYWNQENPQPVDDVDDARAVNEYQGWSYWRQSDFDYDANDPKELDERNKVITARLIQELMLQGERLRKLGA
jgi:hypothetical protein